MIEIRALGTLAVIDAQGNELQLARFDRQLLAALISADEVGLRLDQLADDLYGDSVPASWSASLRNAVGRVRKAVGSGTIELISGRYRLSRSLLRVDAWELLDAPIESSPSMLTGARLSGIPFDGIEPTPTIRLCAERIDRKRVTMIRHLVAGPRSQVSPAHLEALRNYWRSRRYDDGLLELAVWAHLKADEIVQASDLLDAGRREADLDGRPLALPLVALEERIERQRPIGPLKSAPVDPRELFRVPTELARVLDRSMVGRTTDLVRLIRLARTHESAIVSGPSGTGKTFLLASAARELVRSGIAVFYTSAAGYEAEPFAVVKQAIPGIAAKIDWLLDSGHDSELTMARATAITRAGLADDGGSGVCLIIDDAHMMDSHSERCLRRVIDDGPLSGVAVVLATTTDQAIGQGVDPTFADIDSARTKLVQLWPFHLNETAALVRRSWPDLPQRTLLRLASEVQGASGGLPGLAFLITQQVDPTTFLLPPAGTGDPTVRGRLTELVDNLDEHAKSCAVAAAAVGIRFQASEVAQIAGLRQSTVNSALLRLVDAGLVRPLVAPVFEFVHAIHRLAVQTAEGSEVAEAHLRASELAKHERARAIHLLAADAPIDLLAGALRMAAQEHFGHGAWREAAAMLRELEKRGADRLTSTDWRTLSEALDRMGVDGTYARANAFREAVDYEDWKEAVHIAVSGLPETERLHGDPGRVAILLAIPQDRLSKADSLIVSATLARQLMFVGDEAGSLEWATRAMSLAETPDEELFALVGLVIAGARSDEPTPLELPASFNELKSGTLALRGLQVVALDRIERGDAASATQLIDRLRQTTEASDNIHRRWHFGCLETMLAAVQGEEHRAAALSEEMRELGDREGIGDAETAYLGQVLFPYWVRGDLSPLQRDLDRFQRSGDSTTNRILAALVEATGAVDAKDPGVQKVMRITSELMESRSIFAVPGLVMASTTIADFAPRPVIDAVRRRLAKRGGTSVIVGNGMMNLGPVDSAILLLAEGQERHDAACRAIEVADRQDQRLWKITTRLDAASLTGKPHLRSEAEGFAKTDELQTLILERRQRRFD
jgi:DNA-binding transcriptional ArsR family regulator